MIFDRVTLFALRILRAWRYFHLCRYTWRLSWLKAGYGEEYR